MNSERPSYQVYELGHGINPSGKKPKKTVVECLDTQISSWDEYRRERELINEGGVDDGSEQTVERK